LLSIDVRITRGEYAGWFDHLLSRYTLNRNCGYCLTMVAIFHWVACIVAVANGSADNGV